MLLILYLAILYFLIFQHWEYNQNFLVLALLFKNTSSQVWNGNCLADPFSVLQGVKQGCLPSPLLFSLYINDLHECLAGGVNAGTLVKILLYANDLLMLAKSEVELQTMINSLYNYCNNWFLNINWNKSKVVLFFVFET